MAVTANNPSDDKLSALWHVACSDYAKETGTPLVAGELPELRGPEDLSRHLENEKDNFQDFRMKRRPLLHAMQTVIAPFETWGGLIAVASFPPASTIMSAMLLLVRGVRKVSEAFDMITTMFRKLGHFALRLDSYKGVPLSEGMKVVIVKVLAHFLRVCAASQKLVSRGSFKARLTQWAKSTFLEDGDVGQLLKELEELTSQEHIMVSAHGLKLTNQALKNTDELLRRDNQRNDRERLQRIKAALNPVSGSSQVFSSINESRIPKSGAWVEERLQSWWEGSEPILWLHGGPGVGKSFLASKIITELSKGELYAAPAPVVASFFCRNNDVDLRSLNKALRTLAWQVVVQREDFAIHAEEFCLKEDVDNSYVVWRKLLLNYLVEVPARGTCLVIDGIDEAEPEEQEILCSLLQKTFAEDDMSRPPLRVVMLSRDSLRGLLDEHSMAWIDEVEVGNNQNKDDLHGYVAEKLQKTKLFRGSPEFQQEIVMEISREAEGLWEWANLVIKSVLRCRTKEQIRKGIKTMPRGISAMLTQELQRLARELSVSDEMSGDEESEGEGATQINQLNVVLSFVTLAQKPLTVAQLELILEIIFEEEVLNLEDDLRTLYSSLFLLRPNKDDDDDDDANVVVLRHSSFYEFFRSREHSGPVGVEVDQAQVNFLYVLFYVLSEKRTPSTDKSTRALWGYAQSFLSTHLKEASPDKAGKFHRKISALVHELFTKEECREWLIESTYIKAFTQYCFYATSFMTGVGSFWLDVPDRELINKRAEMILQWLLPETKKAFEDHAQASAIASDVCPFAVLFSYIAEYLLQLWLKPQEIATSDGSPAAAPLLLIFYDNMVKEYSKDSGSRDNEMPFSVRGSACVLEIIAIAERLGKEQTPIWHARVAQGLLLNGHYAAARERFETTLAQQEKTPTFDPPSLSVIHRDLSRACTEIGRHAEALKHHEVSESLVPEGEKPEEPFTDAIDRLLNAARLKHRAKRTEDAVATANEAWDSALKQDNWGATDFESFFKIFLELHQPQRLRPVFDRAAQYYGVENTGHQEHKDFADFIFKQLSYLPRTIYQVLQFVLTPDDGDHLDRVAFVMKQTQIETLDWRREHIPLYKYLMANVLFTKGRVDAGLDGWCQAITCPADKSESRWDIKYPQARAIGQLVTVCLERPDTSPCERCPLELSSDDQMDEACLIISAWLRKHGDVQNATELLRGRVKHCIELLSDDDVSNDEDAFKTLFRTFVADPDSDEDCEAALHWIKVAHEAYLKRYNNFIQSGSGNEDPGEEGCEALADHGAADEKGEGRSDDEDGDPEELNVWVLGEDLSECSSCRSSITHIHFWYFCRSCPLTTLCHRCYRELQSGSLPPGPLGICLSKHEFYYTRSFIRPSDMVDEGMVPVVSAEGKKQVIWVEEWKDRLAEKWKTNDFEFGGGLSAWCMRVLPEPQRTRWQRFFQT